MIVLLLFMNANLGLIAIFAMELPINYGLPINDESIISTDHCRLERCKLCGDCEFVWHTRFARGESSAELHRRCANIGQRPNVFVRVRSPTRQCGKQWRQQWKRRHWQQRQRRGESLGG